MWIRFLASQTHWLPSRLANFSSLLLDLCLCPRHWNPFIVFMVFMVLVDGKSFFLQFVFSFRSVPKDKLENFRELFTGYLASFIQSGIPTDPTGTASWTPVNPHAADKPVMQFNLSTADHAFMKPSVYFSNEAQEEPLGMGICECAKEKLGYLRTAKSNCKLSDLSFKQRICHLDLMPPT